MQPDEPQEVRLARRLRALRVERWPDVKVTQQQIAEALGGDSPLSLSLISSWESTRKPVSPPPNRLAAYATFFATRRSIAAEPARLISDRDLTDEERAAKDELHSELLALRYPDEPQFPDESSVKSARRILLAMPADEIGGGTWYFKDQRPIIIVCGDLPQRLRERMPFTEPGDPDYVRSYTYADLDSLIELHGHIRAVNPAADVRIRRSDDLEEDDYTSHLVLIGGVDWNPVSKDIIRRLKLPVHQFSRPTDGDAGYFETAEGDRFAPLLAADGGVLLEDVAHFFRGNSPYNARRTVTLCNGMYGRGTYGAVRALTDAKFRDRNEDYVRKRFNDSACFSILMRVVVAPNGEAVTTPDWSIAENRLHEWPAVVSEA
jgi:hypothetical protein